MDSPANRHPPELVYRPPKQSICPFILLLFFFFVLGKVHYNADFLHEPARLTALVSGACIIFLCFKRRSGLGFLFSFFIYLCSSTSIGVISIASAPGGENISCPIPFLFLFCHLFLFLGLFLFQRNIQAARQPLVPLLFGALLYFLPYFPNLEWLEGWIEGLDLFLLLLGFLLLICAEENEWLEELQHRGESNVYGRVLKALEKHSRWGTFSYSRVDKLSWNGGIGL